MIRMGIKWFRFHRLWAVALVSALVSIFAASVALADEDIQVVSQEAVSDFPTGIVFKVKAQSRDPIDEIRIFYRVEGADTQAYGYADYPPGKVVDSEFLLKTGAGFGFVPPGTAFYYSVLVRDKSGREVRTQEQQVVYMDSRFEWSSISQGPVTVYYYGPTQSRAETILRVAIETIEKMSKLEGLTEVKPIRVVAYNNNRHMALALPRRSAASTQDLVTEGLAFPDKRVTLTEVSGERVEGVVSHELAHIITADAAGRAYGRLPAWLNEGLSEYANLDPGITYDQALRYAIYTRRVKPLWYLREFSGTADDIIIAYGQSKSVVQFMVARYGPEKIAQLMRVLQQTLDIDQAFRRVYGFDQAGLDAEWRKALGLEPLPSPEELERQKKLTPTPSPTPTPTPTVTPEPTPTRRRSRAQATPTPTPGGEERERRTATCNIQNRREGTRLPVDMALFGLVAGPLALYGLRWINRRRDE